MAGHRGLVGTGRGQIQDWEMNAYLIAKKAKAQE